MDYLTLYKKRAGLHGSRYQEVAINKMTDQLEADFTNILGYSEALLNFDEPIDIVSASTTNHLTRQIMLRPSATVKGGDYITFRDNTWIIRTLNIDRVTIVATAYYCNHTLTIKGVDTPVPCYVNSTSFGTKGVENIGKFLELDSKTRIYIQRNKDTERLKLGHRIMLANEYIYRINELDDTVFRGMYIATCSLVESVDMDDFENNLAFNPSELDGLPPDPFDLSIIGEAHIGKSSRHFYSISPMTQGEWALDSTDLGTLEVSPSGDGITLTTGQKEGWVRVSFITRHPEEPFETLYATKDILIF